MKPNTPQAGQSPGRSMALGLATANKTAHKKTKDPTPHYRAAQPEPQGPHLRPAVLLCHTASASL